MSRCELVSVLCGGSGVNGPAGKLTLDNAYDNQDNEVSPCVAYQRLLDEAQSEVIMYVHDDVTFHDPQWGERVLACFDRLDCIAVGLGGALTLGRRDLYRKPYNIWSMARGGYASNQTDWQVHGTHETKDRRVAVLDAFFMAVRCDWLRRKGGWPVAHLTHHCLDLWLACEVARAQKEIWMTGVDVNHHGGGSSVTDSYAKASWLQGGSRELDHSLPHKWLYETYRDVLPVEVGE